MFGTNIIKDISGFFCIMDCQGFSVSATGFGVLVLEFGLEFYPHSTQVVFFLFLVTFFFFAAYYITFILTITA